MKTYRKESEEFFLLCEDLNEYVHDIICKLKVNVNCLPEILSACTYVKIINIFQSIIILADLGFIDEAKILLRSLVESMFLVVAISKNPKFSSEFVDQDFIEKEWTYKALKSSIESDIYPLDEPTLDKTCEMIGKIKSEIKKRNIEKMSKKNLAKSADLESYYHTIYHLLSGSIHVNARDLEKYLELTDEGVIKGIKIKPSKDEIREILFATIETMILALQGMSLTFKIELNGNWRKINETHKTLGASIIRDLGSKSKVNPV